MIPSLTIFKEGRSAEGWHSQQVVKSLTAKETVVRVLVETLGYPNELVLYLPHNLGERLTP